MNDEFPRHCWQNKISFTIPKNVAVTVWTNLTLLIFQSWQEENNKPHYFILLFLLFQFNCIDISLCCVCQFILWKMFIFVCFPIFKTPDIMLHGLLRGSLDQQFVTQPSLETSLLMASVTWPHHSLGSVTQHDAGRGHKYVTQSCVTCPALHGEENYLRPWYKENKHHRHNG